MVSVLQAQPLFLLSTGTVMPSALSIQLSFSGTPQKSANTAWSNSSPYCTRKGSFYFPACYIRAEELTHGPFMHTQPEQQCN